MNGASLERLGDFTIGRRSISRALLEQPVKELATQSRVASVESEGEFVQIRLKLLFGDAAMESAKKPSLGQGGDAMNPGKFFASGSRDAAMPIAILDEPSVGPCAIADDQRSLGDSILNEADDGNPVVIPQLAKPDTAYSFAADFSRDYHDILRLSRGISRRQPADESLVNFDVAGKLFTSRPDHGAAQFVQHRPRRLVARQAEKALESHRIDANFLVGHPPHRAIPKAQRNFASIEDGPSREIRIGAAALTMMNSVLGSPSLSCLAAWADETLRPANSFEVGPA